MTNFGIKGLGTVAASANALKLEDERGKLETAVKGMDRGEDVMSELAESAGNV